MAISSPSDPGPAKKTTAGIPSSEISTPTTPIHPEPAHLRESHEQQQRRHSSATTVSDRYSSSEDEREATELRAVVAERHAGDASGGGGRAKLSRVLSPGKPLKYWYDPLRRFWRHEVRISVPHVDCRDHLANERTYLGYLRTSVILSMIGIFIAQFYRLQHPPDPQNATFGYYVLSKPLSVIFQCAALLTVTLGGLRFWRQQSAMARGKVHAGGGELVGIGVGMLLLLVMLFAVHIALNVETEGRPWVIPQQEATTQR